MKNRHEHTGTLYIIERMPSSTNGNPRYKAMVNRFVFCTMVDSSYGYSITNYDNKPVTVVVGEHRGRWQLDSLRPADGGAV